MGVNEKDLDLLLYPKLGLTGKNSKTSTTIIFYDTTDKYLHEITSEDILSDLGIKNITKADQELIDGLSEAMKKIEKVGNIRFFDINNLNDKDKEYLTEEGVSIPIYPDICLGRSQIKGAEGGITNPSFPDEGKSRSPATSPDEITYIYIEPDINAKLDNFYNGFKKIMIHELLHALGFGHPHDGALSYPYNYDNSYNTEMSYGPGGDGELGPVDILTLVTAYGKNPTFEFTFKMEELDKDLDEYLGRYKSAEELIEKSLNITETEKEIFCKKKDDLEKDGILSEEDRKTLNKYVVSLEGHDIDPKKDEEERIKNSSKMKKDPVFRN